MGVMKVLFPVLMLTTALVIESGAGAAGTAVSAEDEALRRFFLAVGDYYRIFRGEVIIIRERGVPPDEIPVALSIAKRAHVAPDIIVDFRLQDNTWLDTTLHFGLGPEIFFVPSGTVVSDPLYGRVYRYYMRKPKREWKTIVLSDDDIINLANLKLMSEHYGYPPEKIMRMRSGGKDFVSINDVIRKEKDKMKDKNSGSIR